MSGLGLATHRPVCDGFVVHKAALGQVFFGAPCQYHSSSAPILSHAIDQHCVILPAHNVIKQDVVK